MMNHDAGGLLVGGSPLMSRVRELIARVAPTNLPVLIQGETGVGKELVAQAIHQASGRPGALVAFNVCALSDSMFEDALFGHVRGAFTGASGETRGYLGEAHRGTLFLDEICDLALGAQTKLLRAIETRRYRPVGGVADRESDFRVLAASNTPLDLLVESGRFRRDLGYRLRGIVLEIPPLRERIEDVPLLVAHFGATLFAMPSIRVRSSAMARLQHHTWPGNVRELRQVVECALALSESAEIDDSHIRVALADAPVPHSAERESSVLDEFTRRRLLELLDRHAWDTAAVARALGIDRTTVYRRMRRLRIENAEPYRRRGLASWAHDGRPTSTQGAQLPPEHRAK